MKKLIKFNHKFIIGCAVFALAILAILRLINLNQNIFSLSSLNQIKVISTTNEYKKDRIFHVLPDKIGDSFLYTEDINQNNQIEDISGIVHSEIALPLLQKNTSTSSINLPALQRTSGESYAIAKYITSDTYANILYNKDSSALELIVGGDEFQFEGKKIETKKQIIAQIYNVPSNGLIEIEGNYAEVNEHMDIPVKLSVLKSSPVNIYIKDNNNLLDSFETELWQNEATDCSDSMAGEPQLGISRVRDATDGNYGMKLTSRNHYACAFHTFPISLEDDKVYKFQFDYKNLSGGNVMYYYDLRNDTQDLSKSKTISTPSQKWQTTDTILDTSIIRAKVLMLALYAPSTGKFESNIIYDNLSLYEQTKKDISSYYLYSIHSTSTNQSSVGIERSKNEKNHFMLKNINTPFMLSSSAPYTPTLNLLFLDGTKISNRVHYKINGRENGWYVDPVTLCGMKGSLKGGCTMNADGSYNMELIIEFTPQRWFYIGLIISVTTLVSCLAYLGYDYYRGRRKRREEV